MACTFGGQADPVEVSGEFLGHVRLASSRETHHHNDCGGVGKVWHAGCSGEVGVRGKAGDDIEKGMLVYKTAIRTELPSCAVQPKRAMSSGQRFF